MLSAIVIVGGALRWLWQRGEKETPERLEVTIKPDEELKARVANAEALAASAETRVAKTEAQIAELQEGALAGPQGAPPVDAKALAIDREIGYRLGEADNLGNLGSVYADQGELAKAEDHHKQALAIDREIGYSRGAAQDFSSLGLLAARREQKDEACRLLKEAAAIYEEIGVSGLGPDVVRAKLEDLGCA